MNKYKTLIILDWDDTLFPTSWIVNNHIDLADKNMQYQYIVFFSKLDVILYELLDKLTKYGQIAIITNAVNKWVNISLSMLPQTKELIQKKITVLSAREQYQELYPDRSDVWKKLIFEKIVEKYFNQHKLQNILSVGDAEHEFNALINLYNKDSAKKYRLLKTIRFMKDPSFESLLDQLKVFNSCLEDIIETQKHMDLKFNIK